MPRRPRSKRKEGAQGRGGAKVPPGRTVKVKHRKDKPCTTKNQRPIE
jgi:hypothetical protein